MSKIAHFLKVGCDTEQFENPSFIYSVKFELRNLVETLGCLFLLHNDEEVRFWETCSYVLVDSISPERLKFRKLKCAYMEFKTRDRLNRIENDLLLKYV